MRAIKTATVFAISLLTAVGAFAVTWDGGGTDNKWSTQANWWGDSLPAAGERAFWNGLGSYSAIDLDANQSIAGIVMDNGQTSPLSITNNNTLTLGGSGIEFYASAGDLTIDANLALSVGQSWTVQSGQTLTLNGSVSTPNWLNINNVGTTTFKGAVNNTSTVRAIQNSFVIDGASGQFADTLYTRSGGSVTMNSGNVTVNSLYLAEYATEDYFTMNGGTFATTASSVSISDNSNGGRVVFTQTGGTFDASSATSALNVSNYGETDLDLSGGTFKGATGTTYLSVRKDTVMTISGDADVQVDTLALGRSGVSAGAGVNTELSLDGGTLTVDTDLVRQQGIASLNLNGGTIAAGATFTIEDDSSLTTTVEAGGAKFDVGTGLTLTVDELLETDGNGGGLFKSGDGSLILTADNQYTGDTEILAGTLSISNPYLDEGSTVKIASGGMFDLGFSGTNTVAALYLDGIAQGGGTWGATGSGADNTNDSYFSSTGMLYVIPEPATLSLIGMMGLVFILRKKLIS